MLPQIETPRLLLRELCMDDALAVQAFQTRPSYLRCQAMEPSDFKDGVQCVTRYMQYRGEGERRRLYDFVARLHTDGQIVGHGSLSRSAPGIASLGLGIDETYARRGLATEIALRLLAFGFNDLKLHRIEADVALENAACKGSWKRSACSARAWRTIASSRKGVGGRKPNTRCSPATIWALCSPL